MNTTTTKDNELSIEQGAVDRLRRSRQQLEHKLRFNGNTDGRNFVLTDDWADAACQRRLERADSTCTIFDSFHDLAKVLCGDDGSESDWQGHFQAKYGDDIEDSEWIEAFVEGASEKFREIEAKL